MTQAGDLEFPFAAIAMLFAASMQCRHRACTPRTADNQQRSRWPGRQKTHAVPRIRHGQVRVVRWRSPGARRSGYPGVLLMFLQCCWDTVCHQHQAGSSARLYQVHPGATARCRSLRCIVEVQLQPQSLTVMDGADRVFQIDRIGATTATHRAPACTKNRHIAAPQRNNRRT